MKSVKKLRVYAKTTLGPLTRACVGGMLDDIEHEHSLLMRQAVNKAHADGERNVIKGIEQDDELAEMGLMRLPLDANGVPVRVGDVMEWADGDTFEVVGIGGETLFYAENDSVDWTRVKGKRHHHEPTVEDVLRELMAETSGPFYAEDVLLEKYAPRLRLAEEE